MEEKDLKDKLIELRSLPTEILEFKGLVNDNFSTGDIGEYFSALSNEANLRNAKRVHLPKQLKTIDIRSTNVF